MKQMLHLWGDPSATQWDAIKSPHVSFLCWKVTFKHSIQHKQHRCTFCDSAIVPMVMQAADDYCIDLSRRIVRSTWVNSYYVCQTPFLWSLSFQLPPLLHALACQDLMHNWRPHKKSHQTSTLSTSMPERRNKATSRQKCLFLNQSHNLLRQERIRGVCVQKLWKETHLKTSCVSCMGTQSHKTRTARYPSAREWRWKCLDQQFARKMQAHGSIWKQGHHYKDNARDELTCMLEDKQDHRKISA